MLRCLITTILTLFTTMFCPAQTQNKEYYSNLLYAIGQVESRGNTKAVSPSGKYVGWLQIGKVTVDECNRLLGKKKYTYHDRYDYNKSIEMFLIIQNHYNPSGDFGKAIRIWNEGPNYNKKITTTPYLRKVWGIFQKIPKELELTDTLLAFENTIYKEENND